MQNKAYKLVILRSPALALMPSRGICISKVDPLSGPDLTSRMVQLAVFKTEHP